MRLPIGYSDFAQLRRENLTYVDKTGLVVELIRSTVQAVLLPRPRRFGKTLNLTMLRYFFERSDEDRRPLFDGLAVAGAGEDVLSHLGRHPVIFLTFKDVKHATWAECVRGIAGVLAAEVLRLEPLLDRAGLRPEEAAMLGRLRAGTADLAEMGGLLTRLSEWLHRATGEEVVLLVDEYDTPIHTGFARGYYDEVVGFLRHLLGGGLKDNVHLYRGVITGILRVAKESIFSGLNNLAPYSILSQGHSAAFGFTEAETSALAAGVELGPVRDWYNGYRMGTQVVYNPWSVLNYLHHPQDGLRPYWVNTASDDILQELLIGRGLGVQDDLSALLRGESIRKPISENIVLRAVRNDADALWSFLLFCGYLTPVDPMSRDENGLPDLELRIPNREVSIVYRTIFASWMREALAGQSDAPARLGRALLGGDADTFRRLLQKLIVESLSYHDLGTPEAVYQAFIVGLLVHLEPTHEVRSNRESGFGRYDVMVRPRAAGQAGAVIELKVIDTDEGETVEQALDAAMAQVEGRAYATELHAAGAEPVWQWAAVFDGKRAWVRTGRA